MSLLLHHVISSAPFISSAVTGYSSLTSSAAAVPVLTFYNSTHRGLLLFLSLYLLLFSPFLLPRGSNTLLVQVAACCGSACAFKVASLAFKRGVLQRELDNGASLWRFAGALLLPVVPAHTRPKVDSSSQRTLLSRMACGLIKITAFTFLMSTCLVPALNLAEEHILLWPAVYYAFGLTLWLEVDGAGDLLDSLASALFGIEPEPHFNYPPLATGLADLWARRWNLTISSLLRDLVYLPVMEGSLTPVMHATSSQPGHSEAAAASAPASDAPHPACTGSARHDSASSFEGACQGVPAKGSTKADLQEEDLRPQNEQGTQMEQANGGSRAKGAGVSHARKMLASSLTFLFSGLWHELVFAQIALDPAETPASLPGLWANMRTTKGLWTVFFLIQAPAIVVEGKLSRWANSKSINIPRWLTIVATNLFFMVLVCLFWMPPMFWKLRRSAPGGPLDISMLDNCIFQTAHDRDALLGLARQAVLFAS